MYLCSGCSPRKLIRGSGEAAKHRCQGQENSSRRGAMPEKVSKYNRFKLDVPDVGLEDGGWGEATRRELDRVRKEKGVFNAVLRSDFS